MRRNGPDRHSPVSPSGGARAALLLTALLLAPGLLAAQEQSAPAPEKTCTGPRYSDFDFWLGEWDVFVDERRGGRNRITKEEGGCLVLERWTDVQGGTGQSYNFYDPHGDRWRQVWVSDFMIIDYSGGLTADGSMELEGHVVYFGSGERRKLLGRWTPQSDGTVVQYFEQFDPEKNAMVPLFTGVYRKAS